MRSFKTPIVVWSCSNESSQLRHSSSWVQQTVLWQSFNLSPWTFFRTAGPFQVIHLAFSLPERLSPPWISLRGLLTRSENSVSILRNPSMTWYQIFIAHQKVLQSTIWPSKELAQKTGLGRSSGLILVKQDQGGPLPFISQGPWRI